MSIKKAPSQTIFRVCKNKDHPFLQVDKTPLRDKRLSLKAKGLLCLMLSMPDDWEFHRDNLLTFCNDKKDSLATALKELSRYGYTKTSPERGERGKIQRWVTSVYETPASLDAPKVAENPLSTRTGKSASGGKSASHSGARAAEDSTRTGFSRSGKSAPTDIDLNKYKHTTTERQVCVDFKNLLERATSLNVTTSEAKLKSWVDKYGNQYIESKLDMLQNAKSVNNPSAYLKKAIEEDWQPTQPKTTELPHPSKTVEETQEMLQAMEPTVDRQTAKKHFKEFKRGIDEQFRKVEQQRKEERAKYLSELHGASDDNRKRVQVQLQTATSALQ